VTRSGVPAESRDPCRAARSSAAPR
jgi:hypothetical protein